MSVSRYWHTASVLANGKVLVVGGETSGTIALNSTELYDPSTSIWTKAANMNGRREKHIAAILPNGAV